MVVTTSVVLTGQKAAKAATTDLFLSVDKKEPVIIIAGPSYVSCLLFLLDLIQELVQLIQLMLDLVAVGTRLGQQSLESWFLLW